MEHIQGQTVTGKRVLVRCDFDVEIATDGSIVDDYRLQKAVATIQWLLSQGAKVILMGHAGRPGGKIDEHLRLNPVKIRLEELLGVTLQKTDDCIGESVAVAVRQLPDGQALMLENLRFHEGEEKNDPEFARHLAEVGDLYVNDAFAVSHRAHASMVGICRYLPAFAGFQLAQEVEVLGSLMQNPQKPLLVIVGGAKADASKLGVVKKFLPAADDIIVSGLVEKGIMDQGIAFEHAEKMIAPTGHFTDPDISDEDAERFRSYIAKAKTVFWDGPFGKFEDGVHAKGTRAIAQAIISSGAFSIAGGGETAGFLHREGLIPKFSHVSTGGGAMLAFLAGEEMPALIALEHAENKKY